jgi:hypothetical protein
MAVELKECPWCHGAGEHEESFARKGPAARIEPCKGCGATGLVDPDRYVALTRSSPQLPKGWVS